MIASDSLLRKYFSWQTFYNFLINISIKILKLAMIFFEFEHLKKHVPKSFDFHTYTAKYSILWQHRSHHQFCAKHLDCQTLQKPTDTKIGCLWKLPPFGRRPSAPPTFPWWNQLFWLERHAIRPVHWSNPAARKVWELLGRVNSWIGCRSFLSLFSTKHNKHNNNNNNNFATRFVRFRYYCMWQDVRGHRKVLQRLRRWVSQTSLCVHPKKGNCQWNMHAMEHFKKFALPVAQMFAPTRS